MARRLSPYESALSRADAQQNSGIWARHPITHEIEFVWIYPYEPARNPRSLIGCTYCFWVGAPSDLLRHCQHKHHRSDQLWFEWRNGRRVIQAALTLIPLALLLHD